MRILDAVDDFLAGATLEPATTPNHVAELRAAIRSTVDSSTAAPAPAPELLASAAVGSEIGAAINGIADELAWSNADRFWGDQLGESGSRMWFGEVVSIDAAPFTSEHFMMAIQLHDAHTLYPPHRHLTDETYLVVSGSAEWILDDGDWTTIPPGTVIHNTALRVHAMRCSDEPLLMVSLFLPPLRYDGIELV